ncbi:hypothetical protein JCGZ_17822 [Jatropha curcas]|uniref:Non-haem dioxygenase N-terminal domain-containing protein n=1 Tax=Jatropha curcas TaxID=180498 RepID=A0A067K4F1_JATCU|nr:hypothetical protein JCGZ_17822 [Jatropha curcas]
MVSFKLAKDETPLSLHANFILPEAKRPHLSQESNAASIPIIDLNQDLSQVVQQVSEASEEYGFFQVINHGVPQELYHTKQIKLFNYFLKIDGQEDKVAMWSKTFSHPWHSLDDIIIFCHKNPPQYREVVAEYAKEIGELMSRVLGLISQGLGLEKDCLKKRLEEEPIRRAQANFYPPCPEPEITLGLSVHTNVGALTIVLSNGRYKSVHHRAVTNKEHQQISFAAFYAPGKEAMIGLIEDLIDEEHPPVHRSYTYGEFLQEFYRQEGNKKDGEGGF